MAKLRVHEIAKQRGLTSKEVLQKLQAAGIEVKVAASSVEEDVAAKVLNATAPAVPAPVKAQAPKGAPARAPSARPVRDTSSSGGTAKA
nr:translation initiation factor IF-2 N-terminal domain-containing protein [Actinomycetota bacterium]